MVLETLGAAEFVVIILERNFACDVHTTRPTATAKGDKNSSEEDISLTE